MTTETAIPRFDKISDYVFHYADHTPHKEALIWQDVRIDYRSFATRVKRISRALIAAGVGKGDRVALLGTPRPEFFMVMLATVDIGGIWVGLHPRYQLNEFRHILDQASPTLLFAFEQIDGRRYEDELSIFQNAYRQLNQIIVFDNRHPTTGISFDAFCATAHDTPEATWQTARDRVETDDSAVIIFTSGTTGKPKGAMNSHYGLVHCALIELSRWPGDDLRVLQNMPINHIANIGMMSSYALVAGGTLVFMDRFDPVQILKCIETERITFWLQAPAMFHLVVNQPGFATTDLSSLEYIVWGGGPMPQHLIRNLCRLKATLSMAYGMTELTAYVTYADLDASEEALANTIGKPEPRYDLRLINHRGNRADIGESGEIQARGRWLMNGYFNQPQATSAAFTDDGWFKTGDIAELREDGNWKLVGRTKEMYKSGGYNIYPREIEMGIEAHPSVAMCAVLGVPDALYHEVGYAFIQIEPGRHLSVPEITDWCRQRLANYKIPKTFDIMTELPRLPIGKIDKQGLRHRLDNRFS